MRAPCLSFSSQSGSNDRMIEDIKEAIARYVESSCNCVFSSQYFVGAKLVCANEKVNEFIFIGDVLSTGGINSTVIKDTYLLQYVQREETVNVDGQPIRVNGYCSPDVLEEETYRCLAAGESTIAPTSGKSAVNVAIEIAIGAGAGLVVILLLFVGCLVLCICCSRREVRTKYKEPRTDDLSIQ